MRCTITMTKRHMMITPISVEDYLRNEESKANQPQAMDILNKLLDKFAHPHRPEHYDEIEKGGNNMATNIKTNTPNMVQPSSIMSLKNESVR